MVQFDQLYWVCIAGYFLNLNVSFKIYQFNMFTMYSIVLLFVIIISDIFCSRIIYGVNFRISLLAKITLVCILDTCVKWVTGRTGRTSSVIFWWFFYTDIIDEDNSESDVDGGPEPDEDDSKQGIIGYDWFTKILIIDNLQSWPLSPLKLFL